jgi:VWFA-related protein
MRKRSAKIFPLRFLAVGCFIAASALGGSWYAQSQSDQQPSTGPKPNVGETTIAPKKTEPAPATAPTEKKPERINPNDIYTLSTSTNLVNLDVMIKDNNGNPISGLGRKNFKVYDDGVAQAVSNFGTGEAPMTVVMVIEFSNKYWGFLYKALQDAYAFLNFIQPKDWVAVISFDMKPEILADFTQDRSEVRGALDQLRIPGFRETNLYDALAFTIDRMKDVQGRKAIVVICTGIDTFSKLTYGEMLKIAKASDTTIYPVSILEWLDVRSGGSMTAIEAKNQLNYIAQYSGGQAYFPRFDAELPEIYQQIAGQLRTQYSLGFIPTNPAKDGRYHKLKVEVVDDSGSPLRIPDKKGKPIKYRVVSREGYYAPKS